MKILYLLEFDETTRFWYPCVAHIAWIDFNSRIVEIRPSERREKSPFSFLPLSSSSPTFFPSLLCPIFLPFFFFGFPIFFSFFPSYPPNSFFFFFFFAPILFFLFIFHFLFSFIFSSFSFSLFSSLFTSPTRIDKKEGETSPHFPL